MRQHCLTSIRIKTSLQAILLAAFLLIPDNVRAAGLAREVNFDIEPQSLETAIIKFSKQAEIQVLASSTELDGVKTSGVSGRHRVEAALQALLARTGFSERGRVFCLPVQRCFELLEGPYDLVLASEALPATPTPGSVTGICVSSFQASPFSSLPL